METKLIDDKHRLPVVTRLIKDTEAILHNQESLVALDYVKWKKKKAELKFLNNSNKILVFNNQIYWAHLGINIGSEQCLDRPVLVVRSTKNSPICTIIPLSLERLNDNIPYHVDLENGKSVALVEQIRTISKDRIYNYHYENQRYATITETDWEKINAQLINMYTLKPLFNPRKK